MTDTATAPRTATMDKIAALCKRRGFVYPGSEIYGGLANTRDFGPLGAGEEQHQAALVEDLHP